MGCDIHGFSEKLVNGKWSSVGDTPFKYRSYGLFGFLANVRNYSKVPSVKYVREYPSDASVKQSAYWDEFHSATYVMMSDLNAFDYDATFEDRRSNGDTLPVGSGEITTYREFLGCWFFEELEQLNQIGAERIVIYFDC